jgi:tRNA (cmo5U34)-methyltransferase
VVLSPTDDLEKWYMLLWQEWIDTYVASSQKEALLAAPRKYKDNMDNTPDSLMMQLQALESIGFKNVDCQIQDAEKRRYRPTSMLGNRVRT